ncbi:conjugal transfer protein [Streptomyces sp. NPDC001568]|uniref:conjugal transfer protein n=1 Tax=Streptomyces sp. NPDC001568 TaxID=3364588 RepID=UPI0036CD5EAF
MGLPEPEDPDARGLTAGVSREKQKKGKKGRKGQAAQPVNPWEAAGAELAAGNRTTGPTSNPLPPSAAPWAPQDESSGIVFARRFGRGLLWTVVILAAVTGVRSWIFPPSSPSAAPPAAQSAPTYPTAEAQAVAARFGRAYLGWDETKKEERAALLASVLPAGSETTMGWDGKGRQEVLAVQAGTVTPGGPGGRALVRVDVLIRPVRSADANPNPSTTPAPAPTPAPTPSPAQPSSAAQPSASAQPSAQWVGLDVPVAVTNGQAVVTGRPGLVGVPATGPKVSELPGVQGDATLSNQTKDVVAKFFAAYAGGDTESASAPGARLAALPQGVTFKGLNSWSVDSSGDTDRAGTARVLWELGGAHVEMSYRVELTRVSSSDAQRWQVADLRGGAL